MLISTGRVPPREPWHILEVAMNQAPDVMALRIRKELKNLHQPAKALIPMTRNQDGEAQWIIEHVYVRGLNGSLKKLARTPGIDYLRDELAPAEWIAQLLRQEKEAVKSQPKIDDFVRVLSGPCARLCGHLTQFRHKVATVVISMPTKEVKVYTTLENLQIVNCPEGQRTFFFQSDLF